MNIGTVANKRISNKDSSNLRKFKLVIVSIASIQRSDTQINEDRFLALQ